MPEQEPEHPRDPIFLLQERRPVWSEYSTPGVEYDSESESLVDENGRELTVSEAIDRGAGAWTWSTITVFMTRSEGEEWAAWKSYRYPDGTRVHCVPALGDLAAALAPGSDWSPKYTRDHATLWHDCTRDPIFLIRERQAVWFKKAQPGVRLTDESIDRGDGAWTWVTVAVCLTRADGRDVAAEMSCRSVSVYCVAAEGAMRDVLALATIGGRYS